MLQSINYDDGLRLIDFDDILRISPPDVSRLRHFSIRRGLLAARLEMFENTAAKLSDAERNIGKRLLILQFYYHTNRTSAVPSIDRKYVAYKMEDLGWTRDQIANIADALGSKLSNLPFQPLLDEIDEREDRKRRSEEYWKLMTQNGSVD